MAFKRCTFVSETPARSHAYSKFRQNRRRDCLPASLGQFYQEMHNLTIVSNYFSRGLVFHWPSEAARWPFNTPSDRTRTIVELLFLAVMIQTVLYRVTCRERQQRCARPDVTFAANPSRLVSKTQRNWLGSWEWVAVEKGSSATNTERFALQVTHGCMFISYNIHVCCCTRNILRDFITSGLVIRRSFVLIRVGTIRRLIISVLRKYSRVTNIPRILQ